MNPGRIAGVDIHELTVTPKTVWRFVRLRTTDGIEGTGEFTFGPAPADAVERMRAAAGAILGTPATRQALAPLSSMVENGFAEATFFSALEQALADIEAQAAGVPLGQHIGAALQDRILLYANINRRTTARTPEGFAESARLAVSAGFSRVKLAPFDGLSPELCDTDEGAARISEGLARVAAVANAAPGATVMVDCHWRLTEDAAHRILPALEEARVAWFECPVPERIDSVPALVRLRRAANAREMRLAGLETSAGWAGFAPFVEGGAYDVVMPDIKHCGGHDALIEIAERSATHGVATSAHNPSGPIAHAHSLHVTSCIPGDEALEVQFDETPMFDRLTEPAPPARAGSSSLPQGAGLGLSLRADL
ncbi:MAG: enolase C-terminal domain-like protein [Pseudomonadota bacterium]